MFYYGLLILLPLEAAFGSSVSPLFIGAFSIETGSITILEDHHSPNYQSPNDQNIFHSNEEVAIFYNLIHRAAFEDPPRPTISIVEMQFDPAQERATRKLSMTWPTLENTHSVLEIRIQNSSKIKTVRSFYLLMDNDVHSQLVISSSSYIFQPEVDDVASDSGYRLKEILFELDHMSHLDPAHQFGVISWINGFLVDSEQSFCAGITATRINQSYYTIQISANCDSSIRMIAWTVVLFDVTEMESLAVDELDFGWVDGRDGLQMKLGTLKDYTSSAFIIGASRIQLNIIQGADFAINRSHPLRISTHLGFSYLNFSYLNYRTRACPPIYPFYSIAHDLCFDTCPATGSYLDFSRNGQGLCQPCNPFCINCDNSSACTGCDETLQLVAVNGTCVCREEYSCGQNATSCQYCFFQLGGANGNYNKIGAPCNKEYYKEIVNDVCICRQGFSPCRDSACSPQMCYYTPELNSSIIELTKDPDSNTLFYSITFANPFEELERITNWGLIVDLNLPASTILSYSYSHNSLEITATYSEDLQGLNTDIIFDFSKIFLPVFYRANTVIKNFQILPANNRAAYVYYSSTYQNSHNLKYACYALYGLAAPTFILGLYDSKIIAIEMMDVLQISYLGLLLFDYGSPMVDSLVALKYTWGTNAAYLSDLKTSYAKLDALEYSPVLLHNFNVMLLAVVIPIVIGVASLIFSRFQTSIKSQLKNLFRVMVGQWLLLGILFTSYNFFVSLTLFCMYPQNANFQLYISIGQIIFFSAAFTWNMVYFYRKNFFYFGQFKYRFQIGKASELYYYIPVLQRVLITLAFILGNNTYASAIVAMLLLLGGVSYVAVVRPYSVMYHNYRSIFNSMCSVLIVILYLALKVNQNQNEGAYAAVPIGVVLILYVVVLESLALIAIRTLKNYRSYKKAQREEDTAARIAEEEYRIELQMRKEMKEILTNTNLSPTVRNIFAGRMRRLLKKPSKAVGSVNPNLLGQPRPALTAQRVLMVDEMLKTGFL